MKKLRVVRIIITVLFFASLFCTVDLGLNLLYNMELGVHDNSYEVHSILHGLFGIFGDSLWSFERFFTAFSSSAWVSFVLFAANAILHDPKNTGK